MKFFNKISNTDKLLGVVLLLSLLVRLLGLGYSDFYGDETKTFYLDKTIPASTFFLDQRKGPVQFLIVWITEKFINGHSEFYTRLPFSVAGFFSVIAFYLFIKKVLTIKHFEKLDTIYKSYVPLLATLFYSFNGFNVAFSRVIQYQSFMLLFGFLSLYFFSSKKYIYSSIFMGLAILSHYDALFFLIPILFLVYLEFSTIKDKHHLVIALLTNFVVPLFLIAGSFYIPYFLKGYFSSNASSYLGRRIYGDNSMMSHSTLFTFDFYNPLYIYSFLLVSPTLLFLFAVLYKGKGIINKFIAFLSFWFLITYIFYEIIVSNPGTHIHNYFIPLYIITSYCIVFLYTSIENLLLKKLFSFFIMLSFVAIICISYLCFVPLFNFNYPWTFDKFSNIHNKKQIFIYGFPYSKDWNSISSYFKSTKGRVTGIFTNDDDTIAEYYLRGFIYTRPGPNFFPQYYIDVKNNQSFLDYKNYVSLSKDEFLSNYEIVKSFDSAIIYKLKTLP